jgi:DNA modification methylase
MIDIRHGDCLAAMKDMPENSVDAVVTDPPYELGFMGKSWDASGIAFNPDTWREVLRVMKPGAHLVAFGAPKNYHRLACAIEDAGFEIRDSLMWVFGTGFPKSMNVSIAIDKQLGLQENRSVGFNTAGKLSGLGTIQRQELRSDHPDYEPYSSKSDEAANWQGWGTALKPAYEPIVLARKPLSEKTVAANVLRWGTGALNIDATRVGMSVNGFEELEAKSSKNPTGKTAANVAFVQGVASKPNTIGRWPANLCHDGSHMVLDLFPNTGKSGVAVQRNGGGQKIGGHGIYAGSKGMMRDDVGFNDSGSAARFFYSAKASKTDRAGSKHPTVKPVSLMQWLVRMVTPSGGIILDPFAGSGTTGAAARVEGFDVILIEREEEYFADIKRRLELESE